MNLKNSFPFELPHSLLLKIEYLVNQDGTTTINFRDTTYCPVNGGFRPVEVQIERQGDDFYINYLTEFTYLGEDLCRSVDYEFSNNTFFWMGAENMSKIDEDALDFLKLYLNNLSSYLACDFLDETEVSFESGTNTL